MSPVKFPGSNVVYAKDQPEYLPLPAHRTIDGTVTACWKGSWRERFRFLFSGRMYLRLLTFNKSLQPHLLSTENLVEHP